MQETSSKPARRRHDPQLKQQVVTACRQPGASVAAISKAHGLNSHMVDRWRREDLATAEIDPAIAALTPPPSFTAVAVAGPGVQHDIRLELRRGNATVTITWPVSAAEACTKCLAQWLREELQ